MSVDKTQVKFTKGELTKNRLLDAAIEIIGKFGEHQTSFQRIADACDVSQALPVRYFKTRENLILEVVKRLVETAKFETANALADTETASEQLIAYFEVSFSLIRKYPHLGKVYALFYYLASYDPEFTRLNSAVRKNAIDRIRGIIVSGVNSGEFEVENPALLAQTMHTNLTGLILNTLSEFPSGFSDAEVLRSFTKSNLRLIQRRDKI